MAVASVPGKMEQQMLPLNLDLLIPNPNELRLLRAVTSLDTFEGPGGDLHDDGLFSVTTFGRVGDDRRDTQFGYINLRIPVMHPMIYNNLIRLKGLYGEIIAGRQYAVFNQDTKDFESASPLEGQTGYHFFVSHWNELDPKKTGSDIRDLRITLINKYRDRAFFSQLLVLPAGLRDIEVGSDGREEMDEINEFYQSVLIQTRNLPEGLRANGDLSIYDRTRYTLTLKIVEIYKHIENLLSGKNGFIQKRWASRRVFNGTRNVISSMNTTVTNLNMPNRATFNDTELGIYQVSKAFLPKTLYFLNRSILGQVFETNTNSVELINRETLKRVWVDIPNDTMDRWGTVEGREKLLNDLENLEQRGRPVIIEDHYLALVYADDQQNFKVMRSIDELPEGKDPKFVHPMTYIELVYLCGYREWNQFGGFVTRYPIENQNSSYPTRVYVKTTVVGELRYELGDDWLRKGDDYIALEFPQYSATETLQYHDSMSVHPTRLAPLGADFDGDMVGFNSVYSNESLESFKQFFKRKASYLRAGENALAFSVDVHTVALAMRNMTGP